MKIYNYVTLATILNIMLYIGGENMGATWIWTQGGLGNIFTGTSLFAGSFWVTIALALVTGGTASVIAGFFTSNSLNSVIKGTFILAPLTLLIGDFIQIIVEVNSTGVVWISYPLSLLLCAIIIPYSIAIINMWDGND